MPDKSNELDVAYIMRRLKDGEERDQALMKKIDRIEQLRYRKHSIPVPKNFQSSVKEVKIPLIDDVLKLAITTQTNTIPSVSSPLRKISVKEQEFSSNREKFILQAFDVMNGMGMHRPYADMFDQAMAFGLSYPKLLYLPNAWDNDQLKQKPGESTSKHVARATNYKMGAPFPFVWQTPDPRTTHGWASYNAVNEIVEKSNRARYELARNYAKNGVKIDSESGKLTNYRYGEPYSETAVGGTSAGNVAKFIEFWDETDVFYIADGVILNTFPHGLNRVPYFPFFGLSTSSRSPEFESQSVVDNILDLVESIDQIFTMWLNYGMISAFPMGYYKQSGDASADLVDENQQPVNEIVWEPGVFKVLRPGDEMGWVVAPPMGGDLKEMVKIILDLANQAAGIPDVMRGNVKSGTPAWGMQQLLTVSRRVFDPVSENAANALTQMGKHMMWVIENVHKDDIYLYTESPQVKNGWLKMGPKEVDGYYALSVAIDALSDDKRIQMGQAGLQQVAAGAYSMRHHREMNLGLASPEEMELEVKYEKFSNSPQYMELIWGRALTALAQEDAQTQGMPNAGAPLPPQPAPGVVMQQQSGVQPIPGAPTPVAPTPGLGLPVDGNAPPVAV